MKNRMVICLVASAALLSAALIVVAGCGGGGGPIIGPETGPGPSVSAQFLALLSDTQRGATYVGSSACQPCHSGDAHNKVFDTWQGTKHFANNVGCEQCHGPGSVHVAQQKSMPRNSRGIVLASSRAPISRVTRGRAIGDEILTNNTDPSHPERDIHNPVVCGQCHGPTFDQYNNSVHASVVSEVLTSALGSAGTAATCLRCHSSNFKTKYINAPWTYGHLLGKTDSQCQNDADAAITGLLTSDAGKQELHDQAAITQHIIACDGCHSPHAKTGYLLANGEEGQFRRASSNDDPSSVAPGSPGKVTSNWNHICGTCHNSRGGNPSDATLMQASSTARPNFHEGPQFNMLAGITGSLPPGAVVQQSTHFEAPDQCAHCHMPNKRHTFTVSLDSSCLPCHTATDAAAREGSVRNEVLTRLLVIRTRLEKWAQATLGDSRFWDYYTLVSDDPDEQNQAKALQSQIPIEIRRVRHNYYFIVRDRSFGIHNTPYTRQLLSYSESLLDSLPNTKAPNLNIQPTRRTGVPDFFRRDLMRGRLSDRYDDGRVL